MNLQTLTLTLLALAVLLPVGAMAEPPEGADGSSGSEGLPFLDLGGVDDAIALSGATGGIVIAHQSIGGTAVDEVGVHRATSIENSFNQGHGVFGVNQDAGNFSNQGNVVAIALGQGDGVEQMLSVSVEQERTDNLVVSAASTSELRIAGSFNDMTGIVGVNQSAGHANNQINVALVGVGLSVGTDALVVDDHDLQDERGSGEDLLPQAPSEGPTLTDSFQNFRGIAQVSQVNGSLNDVRNVLSVSITHAAGQP